MAWRSPPRLLVGLDPGISTGMAVLDQRAAAPMRVHTLDFWQTTEYLRELHETHGPALLVLIEDPNLNRSLYARFDEVAGARRTKIAQNVGANKRDAQLLLAFCARLGIETQAVAPLGKLDAALFAKLTGIKQCSQHARDAGRLLLARG